MSESANPTQSDVPTEFQLSDTQPLPAITEPEPVEAITEPIVPQGPQADRWRPDRSALMLIGGPIAGALLVFLGYTLFGSRQAEPPEAVAVQAVSEPAPAAESQPAIETVEATAAVAEPEPASQPEPEPAPEIRPAVEPEPPPPLVDPVQLARPDAPSAGVNEVLPTVPQSALATIRGTVRVSIRVTVDKAGAVVDAAPADGGPSRYFERLALGASKKWTFAPEDLEDQRTMLVKFNFTNEGVTARADPDA